MKLCILISALLLLSALRLVEGQDCAPLPCFGCSNTGSAISIICAGGGLTDFPLLPADVQHRVDELNLRSNSISEISAADLVNYTSLEVL